MFCVAGCRSVDSDQYDYEFYDTAWSDGASGGGGSWNSAPVSVETKVVHVYHESGCCHRCDSHYLSHGEVFLGGLLLAALHVFHFHHHFH